MSSLMHLIPEAERPRERCLSRGPESLSLRECLALLIGHGNSQGGCLEAAHLLLCRFGSELPEREQQRAFFAALEGSPQACLNQIPGLTRASQARILAAFELARRYAAAKLATARKPAVAPDRFVEFAQLATAKVPSTLRSSPQEWLAFVPIFGSGEIGEFCLVERGTRTHVNFDPGELFASVLALRPRGFFLFHNHPSGNAQASPQDLELTRRVRKTANELGMRLYGHRIVTPGTDGWAEPALPI